jgi:predicted phosphodiesterase
LTNQPAATRFTLVFFHHPPYTAGGLADAVALFEANGVDVILNGHTHLYARMIDTGIYYFIDGGGGAPLSSCPVAGYTNCDSEYEYIRLLLNNNQLELRVYNSSGTLIDTVDLVGV